MRSTAYICMQVELTGGSQRHPDTRQIHTGINYIDASGKPVYSFAPTVLSQASRCQNNLHDMSGQSASMDITSLSSRSIDKTAADNFKPQPAVLRYLSPDPLVQAGGLYRVSERGSLLAYYESHLSDYVF